MNCQTSQELIQQLLDGASVPTPPAFLVHVQNCTECRDMHTAALVLQGALTHLEPSPPPAYLATRIVAAVLTERRTRQHWRRRFGARLALAASVLFLLLAALAAPRSKKEVSSSPPRVALVQPAPQPPTLRRMATDTGDAVAEELRRTADEKVKQTGKVLSALAVPIKPDASVAPMPPSDSLRGTREGMSSGLEPVTTSARRAFNLFLREVPPLEAEPRTGS